MIKSRIRSGGSNRRVVCPLLRRFGTQSQQNKTILPPAARYSSRMRGGTVLALSIVACLTHPRVRDGTGSSRAQRLDPVTLFRAKFQTPTALS